MVANLFTIGINSSNESNTIYTKTHADLMEIGQLKDICAYPDKVFPETGLDKPLWMAERI